MSLTSQNNYMLIKINDFFCQHGIHSETKVIISIDLDNTLVIRNKGSNYVNPELKKIIITLIKDKRIIFVPNTGRELVGFRSFEKKFFRFRNGILCSGSLIINNDEIFINQNGKIDPGVQEIFISAVKNDILPFIDFSYIGGRLIVCNKRGLQYKALFYSQNPTGWFAGKFPPYQLVDSLKTNHLNSVLRLEFPVLKSYKNHSALFARLLEKSEDNIKQLEKLLNINGQKILHRYSVKNKIFFNNRFNKNEITFGRFEKLPSFTNKGMGLRIWLEKNKIPYNDFVIMHIGDHDAGLINDTIIKKGIRKVLIIMVGEKCKLNNPSVNLYLRGDTEKNLLLFFRELCKKLKIN